MSCTLCGREAEGDRQSHYMGCARIAEPELTDAEAIDRGLLAVQEDPEPPTENREILKEGSMTTVPEDETWDGKEYNPAESGDDSEEEGNADIPDCEYPECSNPKASDHPRAKWCEHHKDPKNRKE